MEDGYRESAESWASVLRDLSRRGLRAPVMAIGDGALGFWSAVRDVWPETTPQRDWCQKMANVLDKLAKHLRPRGKRALREIMYTATKSDAETAIGTFVVEFEAKYPKATACLVEDEEAPGPPASRGCNSRKGEPMGTEPPNHANRCLVVGSDGAPLMPCTVQRAAKLRKNGRARLHSPEPYCIRILDRKAGDPDIGTIGTEVRVDPGARHTGIAVVMKLENEDRVVYQEEIQHRSDISQRLLERKAHRRRRRGTKWFRKPRFNNRRRSADRLPPSIKSIVSNQLHRTSRLAELAGARRAIVETAKFDTQKLLRGELEGIEYQQGPLYRTHLRAFIAEREQHRCAYCGKGNWEDRTRFNLDHVLARARGGATNVGNLVWACEPCNQAKGAQRIEAFLEKEPERLERIRSGKRKPLAAAGQQKWLCDTLVERLQGRNLTVTQTTGADTAAARRSNGMAKSHANDAACAGARGCVTELRRAERLKAIGHGRRKQIKGLPTGEYLAWRHRAPRVRRALGAPRHAAHPHTVHGIRTGDRVRITGRNGVARGRATVFAKESTIRITRRDGTSRSTSRKAAVRRIAGRSTYAREEEKQT